ncbi:MAG: ATP-binding cassette domain-containing protein [Chitinophagaceae bacterium]|nr:ATP-binding cassette domain-containing protein [Chitinophagaceae bacterium]
MLQLNHVTKHFNKSTPNEVPALDDCTLQVKDGEFVVIIGSNGSGKSTLLNLIAGTYFPDKGTIFIDEKNVTSQRDFKRSKYIARVFQDPMAGTAPDLTIIDNFRLAALRTQSKTFKTGVNAAFKSKVQERLSILNLGLENKLETMVGKLSGGQRQALTLLMSVIDHSKILLLDEPTAALDPKSSEKIMLIADKVIHELQLSAILVTHNMQHAVKYGNRLIMMQQGKIIQDIFSDQKITLNVNNLYAWFDNPVMV